MKRGHWLLHQDALSMSSPQRRRAAAKREPIVLVTAGGDGLMPGVDINNSAALLDILEPPEEIRARLGIRDEASRPSEPNQS
jgi:hypothetical protein